jgi:hypothetical protein
MSMKEILAGLLKSLFEMARESWRQTNVAARTGVEYCSSLVANAHARIDGVKMKTVYRFECFDSEGNLKWVEEVPNLVTTAGKNDLLTNYFKGSAYTAAWFVGLVDNASFSAYAAADTMASHAGWIEGTPYSNGTRPTWTGGTAAAGSIDNSASVAAFTINATLTVRGAFLCSNSTKGGSTGILYGEADFGAARSVLSGDTLNVTVTLTAA